MSHVNTSRRKLKNSRKKYQSRSCPTISKSGKGQQIINRQAKQSPKKIQKKKTQKKKVKDTKSKEKIVVIHIPNKYGKNNISYVVGT